MNPTDTDFAAMGLPNQGSCFNWRVTPPEPHPETPVERNARLSRDRYRAGQTPTQKKKALRVNPESSLGYTNRAASDRTLKIKGRT